MTVNDLRLKYIGKTFEIKHSGQTAKCINVNGYRDRRTNTIEFRWCLQIGDRGAWFQTVEVQPVKETLF